MMNGGRSAILTYHSLDDSGSVISTPPSRFQRQMEFLAASGIPVAPLDQVLACPGSVAITFDDGFRNLLDHAVPFPLAVARPARHPSRGVYPCGRADPLRGISVGLYVVFLHRVAGIHG